VAREERPVIAQMRPVKPQPEPRTLAPKPAPAAAPQQVRAPQPARTKHVPEATGDAQGMRPAAIAAPRPVAKKAPAAPSHYKIRDIDQQERTRLRKRFVTLSRMFDRPGALQDAVLLREILGKPVSMRRPGES
jgi:hypothetical protein